MISHYLKTSYVWNWLLHWSQFAKARCHAIWNTRWHSANGFHLYMLREQRIYSNVFLPGTVSELLFYRSNQCPWILYRRRVETSWEVSACICISHNWCFSDDFQLVKSARCLNAILERRIYRQNYLQVAYLDELVWALHERQAFNRARISDTVVNEMKRRQRNWSFRRGVPLYYSTRQTSCEWRKKKWDGGFLFSRLYSNSLWRCVPLLTVFVNIYK